MTAPPDARRPATALLTRRQLLLLHRDQALVVQVGPALLQAGLARRDIGVEVDADGVVANQQVEGEGERDRSEGQNKPASAVGSNV